MSDPNAHPIHDDVPEEDICQECGEELNLTDVSGHYTGKCQKCRGDGSYYDKAHGITFERARHFRLPVTGDHT